MIARLALRRFERCRIELLALSHQHVEWLARFFEWQRLGLAEEAHWAAANIRELRRIIRRVNLFAEFWKRLFQ